MDFININVRSILHFGSSIQRVYYVQLWETIFQIVGVTEAEMKAAHRWKGNGITNLLSQVAEYVLCPLAISSHQFYQY